MSETQNAARLLNPWVFHLQKLGLELKCPLCLDLLNKPMLLPCNHIFCNFCVPKSCQFSTQCPACQQHFTDQEIRPASYMENIVAIYKSLDATFNSAILPLLSTDSGTPISISTSVDQLRKKPSETAPKGKNNHTDALQINCVASGIELSKCSISEELDVNHAPEMSPGSSPSSGDAKDAEGHNSDPGSRNGGTENQRVKKSVGDNLGTDAGGVVNKDTFRTRGTKRQKKLNYGSSDAVLQSHGYSQQIVSHSDQAAVSNCNEECKSKEDTSVISSTATCDASYVNGSVCAFCQSSKITEGTGPLLHYADGKEVARGETAFSKAIPVHSKCIEWTPKVYFVGEKIKNLESELARASKLKCSSCGLKGAALGCFAKSCRRTYHVPCAVEIPDCRWDCDDFVMLCPIHKSIKFPSEKSNSRKRHSGEKCSLSSQTSSEQLNFWATSPNGPQEWVLCGSALSSEEKCLVVKFATICGATVFKFWNPNVTHVIAATDSNGACSRTLKVLMAILNGRWILTMDWIKACVEANLPVSEEPYEVNLDNHGCCDGPRTGRLRASNNAPKLFDGLSFYFNGDFVPSYKSDLLDLVRVGGGTIIESTEQIVAQRHNQQVFSTTFVVYNHDYPQGCVAKEASSFVLKRLAEAEDVAKGIDAQVIPHTWVLESIAASRLLPYPLC
ncbi:hypothetical protein Pfo_006475 [Paulownia fortunei]|nr:hypothetical protein Pfo_006475 [Paulownia fortunei]